MFKLKVSGVFFTLGGSLSRLRHHAVLPFLPWRGQMSPWMTNCCDSLQISGYLLLSSAANAWQVFCQFLLDIVMMPNTVLIDPCNPSGKFVFLFTPTGPFKQQCAINIADLAICWSVNLVTSRGVPARHFFKKSRSTAFSIF